MKIRKYNELLMVLVEPNYYCYAILNHRCYIANKSYAYDNMLEIRSEEMSEIDMILYEKEITQLLNFVTECKSDMGKKI